MGVSVIGIIGTGGRSNQAKRPKMQDITISPINNAKYRCLNCGTVFTTKKVKTCKFCGQSVIEKIPKKPFETGRNEPKMLKDSLVVIESIETQSSSTTNTIDLSKEQIRIMKWHAGEWTIFQISEKIGIPKHRVSKELKFLREHGYID